MEILEYIKHKLIEWMFKDWQGVKYYHFIIVILLVIFLGIIGNLEYKLDH